ncbi:FkbM family methyltransferase [Pararhodobacter zhoushanensis]|uniref:FkbM family methyltransferase n=1 Tax=Pararhodobacter zhoushanensis TaxID=2479545 RepID=UPI000F8DBB6A|nr:FkbM family methyltransferase [Pararhodobacter zhoushanensis]
MSDVATTAPVAEQAMPECIAAWHAGQPLILPPMAQVHATVRNRPVTFHLSMADDPIQNAHRKGRFYEAADLKALARHVPPGALILDIGANVGNHALWLTMFTGAARVIVVEPNPLAHAPLVANVLGNRLQGLIDLDHLGFGLGEESSTGWGMKKHDRNLGATRMFAGQGDLIVRKGDEVFATLSPQVVKIDVEGMEMPVLRGLEALIARARPVIMIEIRNDHAEDFASWVSAHGYTAEPLSREPKHANFLLLPQALAKE